jgi:hypothetical protein
MGVSRASKGDQYHHADKEEPCSLPIVSVSIMGMELKPHSVRVGLLGMEVNPHNVCEVS